MVSWLSEIEMGIIVISWEAGTVWFAHASIGRWKPKKV